MATLSSRCQTFVHIRWCGRRLDATSSIPFQVAGCHPHRHFLHMITIKMIIKSNARQHIVARTKNPLRRTQLQKIIITVGGGVATIHSDMIPFRRVICSCTSTNYFSFICDEERSRGSLGGALCSGKLAIANYNIERLIFRSLSSSALPVAHISAVRLSRSHHQPLHA